MWHCDQCGHCGPGGLCGHCGHCQGLQMPVPPTQPPWCICESVMAHHGLIWINGLIINLHNLNTNNMTCVNINIHPLNINNTTIIHTINIWILPIIEVFDMSHCTVQEYGATYPGHISTCLTRAFFKHIHTLNRNGLPDLWAHACSAWFGNLACYVLGFGRAEPS